MRKKYTVLPFAEQDKPKLSRGKLAVRGKQGIIYVRISQCGIDHHPALPAGMRDSYYPFASEQDGLDHGLIGVYVPPGIGGGSIKHYLSINNLEEILGPSYLNIRVMLIIPKGLALLANKIYSTINYRLRLKPKNQ